MRQAKEAVWDARARQLSQRPVSSAAGQTGLPVLVLGIGRECYGIELADVAEVLPLVSATPVPGASALFAGVINVHGEIRPVIDLQRCLGIETNSETARKGDPGRVILLRREGREMGLQIDSIEQICWVGSEKSFQQGTSPYIKGSTKDLLMLLNTAALFAELDFTQPHDFSERYTFSRVLKKILGEGFSPSPTDFLRAFSLSLYARIADLLAFGHTSP